MLNLEDIKDEVVEDMKEVTQSNKRSIIFISVITLIVIGIIARFALKAYKRM